jgi:hypothetical protein
VFTLITALIHLFAGIRNADLLFILNGVGYLVFLYALLRPFAFLKGQESLVYYGFMAYTAVTILAWLVINGDFTNPVGVVTKIVELLLIVVLWLHMRSPSAA